MQFIDLSIEDLKINPSNDRHGPTASEDTAIAWLFDNKAREMQSLARRIAADGRIFDSPLVVQQDGKYLVKDGNRRATCLKLIHNPTRAPYKFRKFFSDLKSEAGVDLSRLVTCQLEDTMEIADEIIGLRHNGTQQGSGQLMWGPREKAIHANRTSGKSDYEWPQLVESYLIEAGYENEAKAVKRSTLDRVLSAKKRRQKLGIDRNEQGKLVSTQQGYDILPLLLRLVEDMKADRLTLKETLVAKDIDNYLTKLQSEKLLPPEPATKTNPSKPKGSAKPTAVRQRRETLIPRNQDFNFHWRDGQYKISVAWGQLQHELEFKKHKFSIAVVFRTLIEMVEKKFRDKHKLPDKSALRKNLRAALQKLEEDGEIEKKTREDITRILDDNNSTISIENLQRILHSTSHMPSEDDLKTMWDCLEPFMVACLRSIQK